MSILRNHSLILAICFVVPIEVHSQSIDSLIRILNDHRSPDLERVALLIDLSKVYEEINSDTAIFYGNKAIETALQLESVLIQCQAMTSMSETYSRMNMLDSSLLVGNSALIIANRNNLRNEKIFLLNHLSQINATMGFYDKAYEMLGEYYILEGLIYDEEKKEQISELQLNSETAQKETEVDLWIARNKMSASQLGLEQTKKSALIAIVMIVSFFSLIIIFLIVQLSWLKGRLISQEIDNMRFQVRLLVEKGGISLQKNELNSKLSKPLTDRELSVLQLSLSKIDNKEMARKEFISSKMIKQHLKSIYTKLDQY